MCHHLFLLLLRQREREREGERERESGGGGGDRDRERQTNRQTDRQTEADTERDKQADRNRQRRGRATETASYPELVSMLLTIVLVTGVQFVLCPVLKAQAMYGRDVSGDQVNNSNGVVFLQPPQIHIDFYF